MEKDAKNRFVKGVSGNPAGRPKGLLGGRARTLAVLDKVLGEVENLALMEAALAEALRKRPLWFFTNIIMPLLPKETRAALETGDRVIEWRGLVTVGAGEDC